jgi:hypothetical protein
MTYASREKAIVEIHSGTLWVIHGIIRIYLGRSNTYKLLELGQGLVQ